MVLEKWVSTIRLFLSLFLWDGLRKIRRTRIFFAINQKLNFNFTNKFYIAFEKVFYVISIIMTGRFVKVTLCSEADASWVSWHDAFSIECRHLSACKVQIYRNYPWMEKNFEFGCFSRRSTIIWSVFINLQTCAASEKAVQQVDIAMNICTPDQVKISGTKE